MPSGFCAVAFRTIGDVLETNWLAGLLSRLSAAVSARHMSGGWHSGEYREKILLVRGALSTIPAIG
jgi:hypothetical protein